MIIFPAIISGAISAVLGAVAYYLVDRYRTRRLLKQALSKELEWNHALLKRYISQLRNDEWANSLESNFETDVIDAIKLQDPKLFVELSKGDAKLARVYHRFRVLNRAIELKTEGNLTVRTDEVLDYAYTTHEDLDNALNVHQYDVTAEEIDKDTD